jgi:hypothetical protein
VSEQDKGTFSGRASRTENRVHYCPVVSRLLTNLCIPIPSPSILSKKSPFSVYPYPLYLPSATLSNHSPHFPPQLLPSSYPRTILSILFAITNSNLIFIPNAFPLLPICSPETHSSLIKMVSVPAAKYLVMPRNLRQAAEVITDWLAKSEQTCQLSP